jgi:hypothetical protein
MVRTSRIKASQSFAALAVKENQIIFSVALPSKKHRQDEQSESARRGELPKSLILASGDKRAYPRRAVLNCKTQFYNC